MIEEAAWGRNHGRARLPVSLLTCGYVWCFRFKKGMADRIEGCQLHGGSIIYLSKKV